jgi:hypothetical protein
METGSPGFNPCWSTQLFGSDTVMVDAPVFCTFLISMSTAPCSVNSLDKCIVYTVLIEYIDIFSIF